MKKCKNPDCRKPFKPKSKRNVYCSPECYHSASRPKKRYVCKHPPNTKCPMCEQWHYKKDADPKIKRNFCDDCLLAISLKDERTDGEYIYNVNPKYVKEDKEDKDEDM